MTTRRQPSRWSDLKKRLAPLGRSELVALIKAMYDASADNRDFLQTRLATDADDESSVEPYRRRILAAFDAEHLNLREGRRAIREFRKASSSLPGTVELLLTYIEAGTDFTCLFGDMDAPFYDSVLSVLEELTSLLLSDARDLYPRFRPRLLKVREQSDGIGWGYGDTVEDCVGEIEDRLGLT